jgi:hypothetical protein
MKTILRSLVLLFIILMTNTNLLYSQSGWVAKTSGTNVFQPDQKNGSFKVAPEYLENCSVKIFMRSQAINT